MLRLIALAALSMLMFAAAAGSAEAKVFRGKTDKGRRAAVIIGSDGLLRTASVHWRARCIQGGRLADKTYFLRPHDESTPDRFADSGTFRRTDGKGYRLRFTASIRGHAHRRRARRALARHVPPEDPRDAQGPLRGHLPHRAPALHAAPGLDVLPTDVVNAADGWPVAEAAVGPPAVVVADE